MVEPCKLPCLHIFCIQCIEKFMEAKHECPMCRHPFPVNYDPKIDEDLANKIKGAFPQKFTDYKKLLKE